MDVSEILGRARGAGAVDPDDAPPAVPDDISSLDDILPADPAPKRAGKATSGWVGPKGKGAAPKVSAAQKREIADALELIQVMLGGTIQMRDQVCGGAIVNNAANVAAKAVPIICRNPAWVAWFTAGTGWMDVLGLVIALREPIATMWSHHVTHTIGHEGEQDAGADDDLSAFTAPEL